MRTRIVLMVVSCFAFGGVERACRGEDPLRTIIDALDGADESSVTAAEAAFRAIPAGPQKTLATYGIACMRLFQGRYDDAETALEGLPAKSLAAPPFVRLRLWFALQRRDQEESTALFENACQFAFESSGPIEERRATAGLIAGVIAMSEAAPETSVLSRDAIAGAKGMIRKCVDTELQASVKARYREGRQIAHEAREFAKKTLARRPNEASQAIAESREAEESSAAEWKEAAAAWPKIASSTGVETAKLEAERRNQLARRSSLMKARRFRTPGHPGPGPTAPTPPPPYERVGGTDAFEANNRLLWQESMEKYRNDLVAFQKTREQYGVALAEWENQDRERRERIKLALEDVDQAIVGLDVQLAELKKTRAEAQAKLANARAKHAVAFRATRILGLVLSASGASESTLNEALFAPATFPLISLTEEQRRLRTALGHAKPGAQRPAVATNEEDPDLGSLK